MCDTFSADRDAWERKLIGRVGAIPAGEKANFTAGAFAEADRLEAQWLERIRALPASSRPGPVYRSFWKKRHREAGFLS
jgi:hypothetical protein